MPVDVTTDRESKMRGKNVLTGLQGIAMKLTSGPALGAVAGVFVVLTLTVIWRVYKPLFDAYHEGCVETTTDPVTGREVNAGSETVLSANAYAIAYNWAVGQGNRDRLAGFDAYEQTRTTNCNANFQLSQQVQTAQQAALNEAKARHAAVEVDVQLMRDCYDVPYVQAQFDALVPPLDVDFGALINDPACLADVANTTLVNALFNCENLPECELNCDSLADDEGNDNSLLKPTVHGACCTLEWWGHSFVLKISFAVVIYLCLNLFRVLAMMGLNRLLWESLNTGMFTFLGTTNIDGEAQHDEETLATRLGKMLGTFKLYGILLVLMACAAQAPWIIALVYVVPRVAYDVLA